MAIKCMYPKLKMKFVVGKYKPYPSSKKVITRRDIILPRQKPSTIAKRVANVHGYKLQSFKTKTMTELQYRKNILKQR